MTIALAVDNGPTDAQWSAMIADAEKYVPLIEKVIGLYLMRDCMTNEGMIWDDELKSLIPALANLTDTEIEFVRAGANDAYYGDAGSLLRGWIRGWIAEGAPC